MNIDRMKELAGLSNTTKPVDDFLNLQYIVESTSDDTLEEGLWDGIKALGKSAKAGTDAFSSTLSGNVWASKWETMAKNMIKVQQDFEKFKTELMKSKWATTLKNNDAKAFGVLQQVIDKRATYLDSLVKDFAADKSMMSSGSATKDTGEQTPANKKTATTNKVVVDKSNTAKSDGKGDSAKPKKDDSDDGKTSTDVAIKKKGKNLGQVVDWKLVKEDGKIATVSDFNPTSGEAKSKISLEFTFPKDGSPVQVYAITKFPNGQGLFVFTNSEDYYIARESAVLKDYRSKVGPIISKLKAILEN